MISCSVIPTRRFTCSRDTPLNISSSWLAVGWQEGCCGNEVTGIQQTAGRMRSPSLSGIASKVNRHNSLARIFGRTISCGQTSHRLITMLIHGKIICLFFGWYMYCPLSEPLIDDTNCSFESQRTISQVDCSFQFSHWIFKLPGTCVGLTGWLLINAFHCLAVWLCSEGQRETKPRREMVAVFSCLSMWLYKCSEHDLAWWIVSVREAARQEHCLHSLDKRIEGR